MSKGKKRKSAKAAAPKKTRKPRTKKEAPVVNQPTAVTTAPALNMADEHIKTSQEGEERSC